MMRSARKRASSVRGTSLPSAKRRKTVEDTEHERAGDTEQVEATNTHHEEGSSGTSGAERGEPGGCGQREQGGDGQREEVDCGERTEGGDRQRADVRDDEQGEMRGGAQHEEAHCAVQQDGGGAEKDDGAQQKENSPAVRKKSGRSRGPGYSPGDLVSLLDAVEEVMPACSDDWERVAVEYNKYAKKLLRTPRTANGLKLKFLGVSCGDTTGGGDINEMTKRAREIEQKIDEANFVLRSTGTALDDLLGGLGNSRGGGGGSVSSDTSEPDAALSRSARQRKKKKALETAMLQRLDSMNMLMQKAEERREREAERRERKDEAVIAALKVLTESMGPAPPPYHYHQRRGDWGVDMRPPVWSTTKQRDPPSEGSIEESSDE